jgi:hypothetical protein
MDLKLRLCLHVLLLAISLSAAGVACAPVPSGPVSLVSFTENYVEVSISLERSAEGNYILSGTFTPPDGYHLYSKDIPLNGVNGLGRPTLLELGPDGPIKANGELRESVKAEAPNFEPKELLVYPLGPVTLSLPVELPGGGDPIDAEIKVTYMTCSANLCKPPVEGKIIAIRIPGVNIPQ